MSATVLSVDVHYRFAEYRRIVHEVLPRELTARGKGKALGADGRPGWGVRLTLALVLAPMFFYKKWRVGDCRFEFDAQGLRRRSKGGKTVVRDWSEVQRVRVLHEAYLIELAQGAMPLPFQCLGDAGRARFEALLPAGKLQA